MKKYLVSFALFAGLVSLGYSTGIRPVPVTPTGEPLIMDGSVDVSTGAFLTGATFVPVNSTGTATYSEVSYWGIIFSSGAGGDFVSFRDMDTPNTTSPEKFRVYQSTSSTEQPITGTTRFLPRPISFKNGLSWNASAATYNVISVLYRRQ